MPVIIEPTNLADLLKGEQEKRYSREALTIAMGESLVLGEVIGRRLLDIPTTGTADAGNTGNGAMTAVTGGQAAKRGVYTVACITAATNGGTFQVRDPDGNLLQNAVLPGTSGGAVAYESEQINFTLTDAATDFVVGDTFTVEIAKGDGVAVALDLAAVDGSQIAAGFPIAAYDATSAAVEGVAIVRDAIIDADFLTWPAGITADQKTAGLDQLAAKGIISREAA